MSNLPVFLMIGAGKSGTTSIHEYLRQHPKISLPIKKETHFFIYDKNSTPPNESYYGQIHQNPIDSLTKYLDNFEKKPEASIFGEICPSYLFYPNAAITIKKYIPDVKLFCILRNPVDRFYSSFNYRKIRKNDVESFDKIIASINDDTMDINTRRFLDTGFYYALLKRYYDIFPEENIKIFFFEELEKQPRKLMREFMGFIGLPEYPFNLGEKYNRSGNFRFGWFYRKYQQSKLKLLIRRRMPRKLYQKLRLFAEGLIFTRTDSIGEKDRLFLQNIYREDILKLQSLIKKDLSDWLSQ